MPKTLRGVYHNLKESKYTISNGEIVFFFSSMFYLNKFLDGYRQHRQDFEHKIQKVIVDTYINMDALADVTFYEEVEKRGFRAMIRGMDIDSEDLQKYAVRRMNEKETLEWCQVKPPTIKDRMNS